MGIKQHNRALLKAAEDQAYMEAVAALMSEGMPAQEAAKAAGKTAAWLKAMLARHPDWGSRIRAVPGHRDDRAMCLRFLALVAGGTPEADASVSAGYTQPHTAYMQIKAQGLEPQLKAARTAAALLGSRPPLMPSDEAVVVLSQVAALYITPDKPAEGSGKAYVTEAWRPLQDIVATAGLTMAAFNEAVRSAPEFWQSVLRARDAERSAWMQSHREHLLSVALSSVGDMAAQRTHTRQKIRKRKVPFLMVHEDGGPVIEHRESEDRTNEQVTVDPSLAAIRLLIGAEAGSLSPAAHQSNVPSEQEAADLLMALPDDPDSFLLMASGRGTIRPQQTGHDPLLHGDTEWDGTTGDGMDTTGL